jgi:hypothetical protein
MLDCLLSAKQSSGKHTLPIGTTLPKGNGIYIIQLRSNNTSIDKIIIKQ